ncbi:GNAT family N-acetyltransferase [Halobacillus seohaensis]|uniref:GNAT family N-acetyltransferase n=1 Tax=Halobacillus seohaensis TaxID=447421 RepID=A0ABW2EMX0_9BACI
MHFTRYAIEWTRVSISGEPQTSGSELFRKRKDWAADHLLNNDSNQCLLVAEVAGKMVGYVYGILREESNQRVGIVEEIFVDEFYRREGIGTMLFQNLFDWMKSDQIEMIKFVQPPDLIKPQEFIKSLGFSPNETIFKKNNLE